MSGLWRSWSDGGSRAWDPSLEEKQGLGLLVKEEDSDSGI